MEFFDKGAHFYRSDFQIHSPRDRRWVGPQPTDPEDRFRHARQFVQHCREKGLTAVGITDHHDVCFVRYYQLAAQDDETQIGPIDPSRQRPVIFPGVELTLEDPCQAIVLLDAAAPEHMQHTLLQVLGIVPPHPEAEATGPKPSALPFDLGGLDKRLRDNPLLRHRYIILPHVSSPGYRTLLRDGFHEKYRSMPCVGGYIEQDWEDHGKKFVIEGQAREWGNKPIGVFQTSDSRKEDRTDMGQRSTWVKMTEFSAEALRQACLARESRIHQLEPRVPRRYIERVEVSDSVFMGALDFGMNPQFNAIIGGRGTGKSTILEYVRWAMQDQPLAHDTGDEGSDITHSNGFERRRELIQQTLRQARGTVTVTWNVDGVRHIVRAFSDPNMITLTVGDEETREVSPDEIRDLLPVTAYSQKQLSSVSIRTREIQRFIEQRISNKLRDIQQTIHAHGERTKAVYVKVLRHRELSKRLAATRTRRMSSKERAEALEKTLPQLTPEATATISEHPARLRERQVIATLFGDLRKAGRALFDAMTELRRLPSEIEVEKSWPQSPLLEDLRDAVSNLVAGTNNTLSESRQSFITGCRSVKKLEAEWRLDAQAYETRYAEAQEMSAEHKEKIEQLGALREEEAMLSEKESELREAISDLGDVEKQFCDALNLWMESHRERADILEEECRSLIDRSAALIEAELLRGADMDAAMEKLRNSLQGARIHTQSWDALKETLLSGGTGVEKWGMLMLQLRKLAETPVEEVSDDFSPPDVEGWELTDKQRRAIATKLTPERWLELALTSLKDKPTFYYKKGDQRIPFEKASDGEQATALLTVLLNDRGGPLIIDQPEDDLNKELTQQIVEQVWETKQTRQIIFASHDANLVVNGDAELIIWCDYESGDNRSKGTIRAQGAIDIRDIREAITKVMEGGKKAFQLRRQKYGF